MDEELIKECQKNLLQMVRIGNILRFEDEYGKFIGIVTDTSGVQNGFIKIFTNGSDDISTIFHPCLPIQYKTIHFGNLEVFLVSDEEYNLVLEKYKLSEHNKTKLEQNKNNSKKIIIQSLKLCYRKFPKRKRFIFLYFMNIRGLNKKHT